MGRLHWDDIPFERLEVSAAVAKDIFRDDEFKSLQIPSIVERSRLKKAAAAEAAAKDDDEPVAYYPDGTVTCYRLADHVDMSSGNDFGFKLITAVSIFVGGGTGGGTEGGTGN